MKKYLAALLLVCAFSANAQKPLTVGDQLPDYTFQTLFNWKSQTFNLNNFKGKTVLINFIKWGCSHNYDILPFLTHYQNNYKKNLSVITVSDEPDSIINSMFAARPALKKLGIPLARKDSCFQNLFPHPSTPHIVLIGSDRQVKAIIQDKDLNDSLLRLVISGKTISREPPIIEKPLDKNKPFACAGIFDNVLYNSVLTGYAPGVSAQLAVNSWPGHRLRLAMTNLNVKELYLTAWQPLVKINDLEQDLLMKWEVRHPSRFMGIRGRKEDEDKLFCYELIIPDSPRSNNNKALAYVRADLDKFFNLQGSVQKRKITCYVITHVNSAMGANIKVSAKDSYVQQWVNEIELRNLTFNIAAMALKPFFFMDKPLLVEGESTGLFSFKLKRNYKDFETLQRALYANGLKLSVEQRELDCLVIKEGTK
jgi:hypothetical protein